ncbi:MAG TPA: CoA transferase [Candidatus Binataceae bacterium]|jgi:crotonobetainyl-CoA:carnitine CoA-transferase CaiB-like acyl-CoA transferase|nr:CoA transferase [Candidatus Binataceae bacterium]
MSGPFASVKVVEVGELTSAPYAAKLLADLGADVVKVERPGVGDRARRRGPYPKNEPHPEKSGLFLYLNTNKLGVTLDIFKPEGMDLLDRIVADADVLIHNVSPSDMDRTGFKFERFCKHNPRLVMTSITPYGLTGPYRDRLAEELTLWSQGGLTYLNGAGPDSREIPPLKAFGQQAGYQGGIHGAVATVGAMMAQLRDGEGQHIDVSVYEVCASMLELTYVYWPYGKRVASRLGAKPVQPLEALECKDGIIFLCCVEDHQWKAFVELMGHPAWTDEELFRGRGRRTANWDAARLFVQEWLNDQTVQDLYHKAQAKRIPFAPVSTMGDLLSSDHLKARGFFVEISHPEAGVLNYPGPLFQMNRTPWEIRRPAPTLGQHNREVYVDRLKMSDAEMAQLKQKGVI